MASTAEDPDAPREGHCERCDRDYPVWVAPNALWNEVVRSTGSEPFLCPTCFALAAEAKGVRPTAWVLVPETPEMLNMLTDTSPPFADLHLTDGDVRVIKKALRAYAAHLEPSVGFVPEIRDWYKDVTLVLNRIPEPRSASPASPHQAVQKLLTAMRLYPGYKVESRGPSGCILAAIEQLEPETAAKIREGADLDDLVDPEA